MIYNVFSHAMPSNFLKPWDLNWSSTVLELPEEIHPTKAEWNILLSNGGSQLPKNIKAGESISYKLNKSKNERKLWKCSDCSFHNGSLKNVIHWKWAVASCHTQ